MKKEEVEKSLAIFFPKCRKKHVKNEFPLNTVEVCGICEENYATRIWPSLPALKAMFEGSEENME